MTVQRRLDGARLIEQKQSAASAREDCGPFWSFGVSASAPGNTNATSNSTPVRYFPAELQREISERVQRWRGADLHHGGGGEGGGGGIWEVGLDQRLRDQEREGILEWWIRSSNSVGRRVVECEVYEREEPQVNFRWRNSSPLGAGRGRRYLLQLESFQRVLVLLLPVGQS